MITLKLGFRSLDLFSIDKCAYTWKHQKALETRFTRGRVQHTVLNIITSTKFVIEPDVDKRTTTGKQAYRDFLDTVGERTPITSELYEVCMDRRDVVADYIPNKLDKVELTLCYEWAASFKSRLDWYDGRVGWIKNLS